MPRVAGRLWGRACAVARRSSGRPGQREPVLDQSSPPSCSLPSSPPPEDEPPVWETGGGVAALEAGTATTRTGAPPGACPTAGCARAFFLIRTVVVTVRICSAGLTV